MKNSVRDSKKEMKMAEKWQGPYIIHEDLGNGCYKLKNASDVVLKRPVNAARLKLVIYNCFKIFLKTFQLY